jgi:hypothetical protein
LARTTRKLHKATGRIFYPRSHLHPQHTDPHSPHTCSTPGGYTFTNTSPSASTPPLPWASATGWTRSLRVLWLLRDSLPGELTSQQTLSPGRAAHRSDNQSSTQLQPGTVDSNNNNNNNNREKWVWTPNKTTPPNTADASSFNCMSPGRHLSSWSCMRSI